MAKLTLSVDSSVVSRARVYAKQRGTSISRLVETYLLAVTENDPRSRRKSTPVLNSLTGVLRSADPAGYGKYLEKKYR